MLAAPSNTMLNSRPHREKAITFANTFDCKKRAKRTPDIIVETTLILPTLSKKLNSKSHTQKNGAGGPEMCIFSAQ